MSWEFNKIYQRLWDDENFCTLPGDHQAVVFYLLTNKEGNRIGLYRLSVAMASEKLKLSPKVFQKRLKAVCTALSWSWDPKTGLIFIPTWFKYYPIAEGAKSNLIGYMRDLRYLPRTGHKNNLIGRFKLNQAFIPSSMKELFIQQFHLHIGTPPPTPRRGGVSSEIEIEKEIEKEIEIKTENANALFSFFSDQKDLVGHRSPARPFPPRSGHPAEPVSEQEQEERDNQIRRQLMANGIDRMTYKGKGLCER